MTLASSVMTEIGDFEVSIDDIISCLSKEELREFENALSICQRILDNPSSVVGSQAIIVAAQLASLRTKLGIRAQYYKTTKIADDDDRIFRKRKDLLLTIYNALEENINTLKLLGRIESRM